MALTEKTRFVGYAMGKAGGFSEDTVLSETLTLNGFTGRGLGCNHCSGVGRQTTSWR